MNECGVIENEWTLISAIMSDRAKLANERMKEFRSTRGKSEVDVGPRSLATDKGSKTDNPEKGHWM